MLALPIFFLLFFIKANYGEIPLVINTWRFTQATETAWERLKNSNTKAVDAVIVGCTTCEIIQCDYTVGYGGSPDENGETTLDAMIFDGATMDMGAVAGLRRVKDAINVAGHVLKYTEHSILVGDLATEFAKNLNFREETLSTNYSIDLWQQWMNNNCQPNFWKNVVPNHQTSCGPYKPGSSKKLRKTNFEETNHDTIGMIAIDTYGNIAAGTSSNGAKFKIPGRIGDAPLPGAGAYADNEVGAAVATGDGDIMMRFLPSFLAVEELRRGSTPTKAAIVAIERIAEKYPTFFGGLIVVDNKGRYGAACNGMDYFPFSVASSSSGGVIINKVPCTNTK